MGREARFTLRKCYVGEDLADNPPMRLQLSVTYQMDGAEEQRTFLQSEIEQARLFVEKCRSDGLSAEQISELEHCLRAFEAGESRPLWQEFT